VKRFIVEAYDELMNKVTWPSWGELQNSSVIVLIASFIIAGIIYVMDVASSFSLKLIYSLFQ